MKGEERKGGNGNKEGSQFVIVSSDGKMTIIVISYTLYLLFIHTLMLFHFVLLKLSSFNQIHKLYVDLYRNCRLSIMKATNVYIEVD